MVATVATMQWSDFFFTPMLYFVIDDKKVNGKTIMNHKIVMEQQ